jgi:hypothetical protein
LLGRALAVLFAVAGQPVQAVSAQQLAALQPTALLAHLRPFPESPRHLVQTRELDRAVVRDQGRQRLALKGRRLAVGEAGVHRLGQHPADRFQRSALDLIKCAALASEREAKGIGRRLPELVAPPAIAKLPPQALGKGLGIRAQPVARSLFLAALGIVARLRFVVRTTRRAEIPSRSMVCSPLPTIHSGATMQRRRSRASPTQATSIRVPISLSLAARKDRARFSLVVMNSSAGQNGLRWRQASSRAYSP